MQLVAPNFLDWKQYTTGDGAVSINSDGSIVTFTNGSAGNRAQLQLPLLAFPGDTIRVSVLGKRDSGALYPLLGIEEPSGITGDVITCDSEEWKLYTLEYSVPLIGNPNYVSGISELCVTIGFGGTGFGSCKFTRPHIELINGQSGGVRRLAQGLLRIKTDNTCEWLDSYRHFGFASTVTNNAGAIAIDLVQPIDMTVGRQYGKLPNIQVTPASNNQAGNVIVFGTEGFSNSTGSFVLKGFSTNTQALVTDYTGLERYVHISIDY